MPPKRRSGPPKGGGSQPSAQGGREILFELIPLGNSVKVSALDPESGIEVSTVGPANASIEDLQRAALAKLRYVMNKGKA